MGYVDLIPDVFRLTMPDLATGKSYHTQKFNVGNKQCIGVTIKASQALSVAVAYGIATDTAAAAGVDIAASLPYKTSATSFASNTSTEGGTYHEIAVPPHARQAQLVISNASGSTVSGAVIDAALRVVAYPAASGSGSSDFASITGWPGSSSQFVHADGSYSPLSAAEIRNAIYCGLATGTANALVAAAPTGFSLADGVVVMVQIANTNTTTATLNVGGTGAKDIHKPNAGSNALVGGELVAGSQVAFIYRGASDRWIVASPWSLRAGDALAGFSGTKSDATVALGNGAMGNAVSGNWGAAAFVPASSSANALLRTGTSDGLDNCLSAMLGGASSNNIGAVQIRGSLRVAHGNEHATYPGVIADCVGENGYQSFYNAAGVEAFRLTGGELRCPSGNTVAGANAERWIGPRSGSSVSWFANAPTSGTHGWGVNGTESFRVDANGPRGDAFTPLSAANAVLRTNTSAASDTLRAQMAAAGAVDATRGAINEVVGVNATNEAGANHRRATGMARAASTSFNLVAIAATDCGVVRVVDDSVGGGYSASINILNGAVTSVAGDTAAYVTTPPTSTQCRFFISGGFLVATTGSGWTRKFGVQADLVRMV